VLCYKGASKSFLRMDFSPTTKKNFPLFGVLGFGSLKESTLDNWKNLTRETRLRLFQQRERERERERMSAERKEQQQQQQQHSAERKQFNELQTKYIETTQKLKQLQSQFQQKHVDKQRALLTAKELSSSSSSSSSSSNASGEEGGPQANLYKPLGRGFVLRSRQQIEKELSETVRKAEKMMDDCQNQKTFLEGKTQEIERNLRELLQGNEGLQRELHEAGLLGGGML